MRTQAREAALNIIFAEQFNKEQTDSFQQRVFKNIDLKREEDIIFASDLLNCVHENQVDLEKKIDDACHHYHVDRINPMDKTILLIAMAEICYFGNIPAVVSVSEAAALAKKYSSEMSVDFVHGVLAGFINQK